MVLPSIYIGFLRARTPSVAVSFMPNIAVPIVFAHEADERVPPEAGNMEQWSTRRKILEKFWNELKYTIGGDQGINSHES